MDKARRDEHRKLMAQGDQTLNGSKHAWLRSFENLRKSEAAMRSQLATIKQAVRMPRGHLPELLNHLCHRIIPPRGTTSEGFNSLIQNIKTNARGLPNFTKFRTRILFYCGKLNMLPA